MGILGKIIKTTLSVAEIPIVVIKDSVTVGGTMVGREQSYTGEKLKELKKDYDQLKEKLEDL